MLSRLKEVAIGYYRCVLRLSWDNFLYKTNSIIQNVQIFSGNWLLRALASWPHNRQRQHLMPATSWYSNPKPCLLVSFKSKVTYFLTFQGWSWSIRNQGRGCSLKCPLRIIKALSYIVCYSRPFFQVLDEGSEFGGVTGWCRALLAVNCSPLQVTEPTKLRVALKESG